MAVDRFLTMADLVADRVARWRAWLLHAASPDLVDLVRGRLDARWELHCDGFWAHARPVGATLPGQGWKLHVSTVPISAAQTLARCVDVLREGTVPFKFGEDLAVVTQLVSARYEETGLGKFLTAYPATPEQFVALADQLADATAGLPGPPVPSDARWRAGSPVYHRFGVFTGQDWLTDDGALCSALIGPDGARQPDERGGFHPPSWAPALPDRQRGGFRARQRTVTLALADRFRITSVLRRSARGGVFSAHDTATGCEVVVKHVRPHVGADPSGRDAGSVLRHEAEVLAELAATGAVPTSLGVIRVGETAFLVEHRIPGTDLRAWVRGRWRPQHGPGPQGDVIAARLAEAVASVHRVGYVLRDLSPSNVMVSPDLTVALVDLELAARPGDLVQREYTIGYAAPEQNDAALIGPAPTTAADAHAFGGVLFFLATAADPVVLSGGRDTAEVLTSQLTLADPANRFARRVRSLVGGLRHSEPELRPTMPEVLDYLTDHAHSPPVAAAYVAKLSTTATLTRLTAESVLADGLSWLANRLENQDEAISSLDLDAPWRPPRDPCCAGHGAAGPLLLAVRAAELTGRPDLSPRAAILADAIVRRLPQIPRLLPGLASGRAGTLWALWEAARHLEDAALATQCLAAADALTVVTRAPGIPMGLAHGAAGTGLLHLRLWLTTGEPRWRDATVASLEHLLSDQTEVDGFATGRTGVAFLLLHAGVFIGHEEAVRRATEVVAATAATALARTPHGAHGLSHDAGLAGSGRLLVAAAHLLGDKAATNAVIRLTELFDGWAISAPPGFAAGISGWGEFLLDCDDLSIPGSRDRLTALVAHLIGRANSQNGRWQLPDDSGTGSTGALADGVTGCLWFLTRALHGGSGLWDPRA